MAINSLVRASPLYATLTHLPTGLPNPTAFRAPCGSSKKVSLGVDAHQTPALHAAYEPAKQRDSRFAGIVV